MKKIVVLATLLLAGCGVSQAKYDEAVKTADAARSERAAMAWTARSYLHKVNALGEELDAQRHTLDAREQRLGECEDKAHTLQTNLDAITATDEQMRRAHDMAEARAALYRQIALRLKGMVDARELSIVLRDGRMVLRLPNDVLFDSGSTYVKPAGVKALTQIGSVLKTIPDRHFQVAGHTDNVPIATDRFASNWELSTQRAVEVVRVLARQGVKMTALSAAGYGEFDPVGSNDSVGGRQRNRRIEITLQPQIDEFVSVPTL